jgi:hypothetical protein
LFQLPLVEGSGSPHRIIIKWNQNVKWRLSLIAWHQLSTSSLNPVPLDVAALIAEVE